MRRLASVCATFALVLGLITIGVRSADAQEATPADGQEAMPLPPNCTVVASGLINPRFVAVAADGTVYVSESGSGGDEELFVPEEMAQMLAEEGEPGAAEAATPEMGSPEAAEPFGSRGGSGQVTMVAPDGTQSVLATGLPSYAFGLESTGAAGIAVADDGTVWLAVGGAGPFTPFFDPLPNENSVVKIDPATGEVTAVADIGANEKANNPEPFAVDSNLYGLDIAADGALIVADAGGNAVYRVDPASGELAVLAVIPGVAPPADMEIPEGGNPERGGAIELDPVPTGIEVAADGTITVGLLGALVPGAAKVLRLAGDGTISDVATGLSNVVDVAAAPDGTIYASQISTDFESEVPAPGNVVRIGADGTAEVVLDNLPFPNGIAFDSAGALYVVVNTVSVGPPQGQVLRCDLTAASTLTVVQTIELRDYAFAPREVTIPADTEMTLRLENRGFVAHNLSIDALGLRSPLVRPGKTETVMISAAPGDYLAYCSVPGHRARGMVGNVHVVTS
jgi:plastocyanin